MRKTYEINVLIGGVPKTHKIKVDNKKKEIKSNNPSSFIQWRKAELEKIRNILCD